jgi:hypothetical protein
MARLSRGLASWLKNAWLAAFRQQASPPPEAPNDPDGTPPQAKPDALREGAVLSESVDAVSRKKLPKG